MEEVRSLTDKNATLVKDVEHLTKELEDTIEDYEAMVTEQARCREALAKADQQVDTLSKERDGLHARLEDLITQLDEKENVEGNMLDNLQDQIGQWRSNIADLQDRLQDKELIIARLEKEMDGLQQDLVQSGADVVRKDRILKDAKIKELEQRLEQSHRDFELLSIDWDRLDKLVKSQDVARGVNERASKSFFSKKSKNELEQLKEVHQNTLRRLDEAENTLAEKENRLLEVSTRLHAFEQGAYGLKEALDEIGDLKVQKSIRDTNISELTEQLNKFSRVLDDLADENRELRVRCGLDPETAIDISSVKRRRDIEFEQLKAINIQFQDEIDRLEEERISLKTQLRADALKQGERAAQLGVDAADFVIPQDHVVYKPKQRTVFSSDSDNGNFSKLTKELEMVHHELKLSREERQKLMQDLKNLKEENDMLQNTTKKLAETVLHTASDAETETVPLDAVNQLLERLLSKSRAEDRTAPSHIIREVNDDLNRVNTMLRLEIDVIKKERDEAIAKVAELQYLTENRHEFRRFAARSHSRSPSPNHHAHIREHHHTESPSIHHQNDPLSFAAMSSQLVEAYDKLARQEKLFTEVNQRLQRAERKLVEVEEGSKIVLTVDADQEVAPQGQPEAIAPEVVSPDLLNLSEQIKEQNLLIEQLQNAHEWASDELKHRYLDLSRKNVLLKVNEKMLSRRVHAAEEIERSLRTELQRVREEYSSTDMSNRTALCDLNSRFRLLRQQFDRAIEDLEQSVPASDFHSLQAKNDALVVKYRSLLEKERNFIENKQREIMLTAQVEELQAQIDALTLKFTEVDADPISTNIDDTDMKFSNEILRKKLQYFMNKCASLENNECELKKLLEDAESKLAQCQSEVFALQETDALTRALLAQSTPNELVDSQKQELHSLKEQVVSLRSDVEKYRDLCEVAKRQSAELNLLRVQNEKECEILRAAIKELEIQGEEKFVISKLHQRIFILQKSEAQTLASLKIQVNAL